MVRRRRLCAPIAPPNHPGSDRRAPPVAASYRRARVARSAPRRRAGRRAHEGRRPGPVGALRGVEEGSPALLGTALPVLGVVVGGLGGFDSLGPSALVSSALDVVQL